MRENRLLSLLLTAAMLAAAATFTACSGDKDGTSEKETDKPDSGEGTAARASSWESPSDWCTPTS